MSPQAGFWIAFGAWVVVMVLAWLVPATTPPADFGLTRGLNRVTIFLQFQLAGLLLALVLLWLARTMPPGRLRLLARLPALVALATVGILSAVIGWAVLRKPPPAEPAPERPVTARASPGLSRG
ncbi:MAG: hypothetical protein KJZ85_00990 [Rhodobacteraceae bacterium]|jgi:hypothetical protein|nr:hypothetical protein [Paracoccaceae bacterium]